MADGKAPNKTFPATVQGNVDIQTPNGYINGDDGNPYQREGSYPFWYRLKPQDIIGTGPRVDPITAVQPTVPSSKSRKR